VGSSEEREEGQERPQALYVSDAETIASLEINVSQRDERF
jgi:hypothetical protein